jgi:hypothetical protein
LEAAEIRMPGMVAASAQAASKKVLFAFAFIKSSTRNLIEVGNNRF